LEKRPAFGRPAYLARLFIDALLQFVDHLINAEACRSLTRRIFLERAQEGRNPPYTVLNQVGVFGEPIVILVRNNVRTFHRVHAKIEDLWRAQTGERIGPDLETARLPLLAEYDLPIVVPVGDQISIVIEVVKLVSRGPGLLPGQVRQLIVSI